MSEQEGDSRTPPEEEGIRQHRFSAPPGATTVLVVAVMLFSDRDIAPIFGHLSQLAGVPHR